MDKKVAKKNTGKTVPKKTNVKKSTIVESNKKNVAKKAAPKTTVKPKQPVKKTTPAVKEPKIEKIECRFCKKDFEKGLTICPSCKKNQKDQTGLMVIGVLLVLLLLSIIGTHFLQKYYNEEASESDYKYNSVLASYEDLVRSPKDYKNSSVKVIGKVIKVDGKDNLYGNSMTVTIDANLFDGNNKQLIKFDYTDESYKMGFIEGDIITIYGEYKLINGNVPFIEAKYITFGS